jgi:hypothetical protein
MEERGREREGKEGRNSLKWSKKKWRRIGKGRKKFQKGS